MCLLKTDDDMNFDDFSSMKKKKKKKKKKGFEEGQENVEVGCCGICSV